MPLQFNWPLQSPVWHEPVPVRSKLQPWRAHILPDHQLGVSITTCWPLRRWKPPPFRVSWAAVPKIAGQMSSLQLLAMMSFVPPAIN